MLMNKKLSLTLVVMGLSALGCSRTDPNARKLQYMPDMADAPSVKAQESYINPPDNSVPVNGVLYPDTVEAAEADFKNPLPATEDNLAKGQFLFETYCAVCHGKDGHGQGTLGTSYPIGVPNIARADLAQRKDGFFFMKITNGKPMMPKYGHSTDPQERWQIILYLRKLQNQ